MQVVASDSVPVVFARPAVSHADAEGGNPMGEGTAKGGCRAETDASLRFELAVDSVIARFDPDFKSFEIFELAID